MPLRPLNDSVLAQYEAATSRYQEALIPVVEPNHQWDWLLDRGLSEDAILTNRLGVVVDPLPEHARYEGMVSIPFMNANGQVVGHRFRCVEDHEHEFHGKYNGIAGHPTRPFNLRVIPEAGDSIHVTEGEFDAMILTQAGFPSVAIVGANNWKPHYRVLLDGFEQIHVWGDPDEAGAKFARTVGAVFPETARTVRIVGGDVNEVFLAGGVDALTEALERV